MEYLHHASFGIGVLVIVFGVLCGLVFVFAIAFALLGMLSASSGLVI